MQYYTKSHFNMLVQNRKKERGTILFPIIQNKNKYNQKCSNPHKKYLSPLVLSKSLTYQRIYTHSMLSEGMRLNQNIMNTKRTQKGFQLKMNKTKMDEKSKENSMDVIISNRKIRKIEGNLNQFWKFDSTIVINLASKKVNTIEKPPHRYKTTMLIFRDCLILYGGLGCQKNLTWAKLSFESMKWEMPKQSSEIKKINTYVPCSPIYGHSMVKYKDMAIIYGGSCTDQINQTTLINSKSMQISQGARCPFRRKQHAVVVVNDLMVVHGGIQARETKSQLFIYSITYDKWFCLTCSNLPALSGHRMAKGKNSKEIYMFGGNNSKGKATNKLYKLKNISIEVSDVKWQEVQCSNTPKERSLFCFERLTNNFLLLYGGKQDKQTTKIEQGVQSGVFNDVHVFNMEKKIWYQIFLNNSFEFCFGMASTCINGAVFIYGGSAHSKYADASINIVWNSDLVNDPWMAVEGADIQACSSKRISNKMIA